MRPFDVVCVGLSTADTIVDLPRWPEPDGRMEADAIVRSFGGPAATAAVTLARLGHRVAFVGAVGEDAIGPAVRDSLSAAGVDVRHVAVSPGRTGESVILLDRSAATRSILHAPGVRLASLAAGGRADLVAATWIHADDGGFPLVAGLDRARLSVDHGHRTDGLALDGLGLYAPSRGNLLGRFAGRSLGQAVRAALDEGAMRVAVTLGGDGAVAADAGGAWRVGGVAIEVVSTLGAGDVFHGALLASLLDGLALADAVRRANVAAALSCRAIDGRGGIPTRDELEAALAAAPPVEPVVLEDLA
jgi:sulfofructose kinase